MSSPESGTEKSSAEGVGQKAAPKGRHIAVEAKAGGVADGKSRREEELTALRERGLAKNQRGKYNVSGGFPTPEEAKEYLAKTKMNKRDKVIPTPPSNLNSADLNDWYAQQRQRDLEERKRREEAEAFLRGYRSTLQTSNAGSGLRAAPQSSNLNYNSRDPSSDYLESLVPEDAEVNVDGVNRKGEKSSVVVSNQQSMEKENEDDNEVKDIISVEEENQEKDQEDLPKQEVKDALNDQDQSNSSKNEDNNNEALVTSLQTDDSNFDDEQEGESETVPEKSNNHINFVLEDEGEVDEVDGNGQKVGITSNNSEEIASEEGLVVEASETEVSEMVEKISLVENEEVDCEGKGDLSTEKIDGNLENIEDPIDDLDVSDVNCEKKDEDEFNQSSGSINVAITQDLDNSHVESSGIEAAQVDVDDEKEGNEEVKNENLITAFDEKQIDPDVTEHSNHDNEEEKTLNEEENEKNQKDEDENITKDSKMEEVSEIEKSPKADCASNDRSVSEEFIRKDSAWHRWITSEDGADFFAEAGRYHVYAAHACPWSHRVIMTIKLKGLGHAIGVTYVHPTWQYTKPGVDEHRGWVFGSKGKEPLKSTAGFGNFPSHWGDSDPHLNSFSVRELYEVANDSVGKYTVPILWDTKMNTIVNNDSSEIIRILNSEFNDFAQNPDFDLFPERSRKEIEAVNEWVYPTMNNGVYRCGFASSQEAYDIAIDELTESFDRIDFILQKQRFVAGNELTEADVRLFPTLLRLDEVYDVYFKVNTRSISSTPAILNYMREIYQMEGIAETCNMDMIKAHYFTSHVELNKFSIIPRGESFITLLSQPHNREDLN